MLGTIPSQAQQNAVLGYPNLRDPQSNDHSVIFISAGLIYGADRSLYSGSSLLFHSQALSFAVPEVVAPIKLGLICRLAANMRKCCILTVSETVTVRIRRITYFVLFTQSLYTATKCVNDGLSSLTQGFMEYRRTPTLCPRTMCWRTANTLETASESLKQQKPKPLDSPDFLSLTIAASRTTPNFSK